MDIGYFAVMLATSLTLIGFGLFRRIDGLTTIGASLLILLGLFIIASPLTSTTYLISATHFVGNSTVSNTTYYYTTKTVPLAPAQYNMGDLIAIILILVGVATAFGSFYERKM